MQPLQSIEISKEYKYAWDKLKIAVEKQRIANGLIFAGINFQDILNIAYRLMTTLSCSFVDKPCGNCRNCHLILNNSYENLCIVKPESSVIKVEQIRALQSFVFSSSLNQEHKFILIEHADKMHPASSNALLKILEEPPINTSFILLVKNTDALPVTILSRCQQYYFDSFNTNFEIQLTKTEEIIDVILKILRKEISPCATGIDWKTYDFTQLLTNFYHIIASAINYSLIQNNNLIEPYRKKIEQMVQLTDIFLLFEVLNNINQLHKQIKNGVNLNITLSVECLLIKLIVHK